MIWRSGKWVALVAILLLAGALRFYGIDWDAGIGAHPDERYVVGLADGMVWPGRLDPFDLAPEYPYGHLPVYLLAATRVLARAGDSMIPGRVLAGLFGVGTVALTFALARRVFDEQVGLLATAFAALTALHVQQAHFYTADALLGFFTLGALLSAVRLAEDTRVADAWFAGGLAGLALGTKASAALLAVPLLVACSRTVGKRRGCLWRVGLSAIAAFALTNPFAERSRAGSHRPRHTRRTVHVAVPGDRTLHISRRTAAALGDRVAPGACGVCGFGSCRVEIGAKASTSWRMGRPGLGNPILRASRSASRQVPSIFPANHAAASRLWGRMGGARD
jgi:predicted membrane-bound mannosyltransferase